MNRALLATIHTLRKVLFHYLQILEFPFDVASKVLYRYSTEQQDHLIKYKYYYLLLNANLLLLFLL